ncbi:MAG: DUF1553 domain-containing protein [Gemmataceae bacterium]
MLPGALPAASARHRQLPRYFASTSPWLTGKRQPAHGLAIVNRPGLSSARWSSPTMDDLAFQGAWPTHPALLDWPLLEFANGWDVKKTIRTLVTTSVIARPCVSEELENARPYNTLCSTPARPASARRRAVRDNALAVSGLLALEDRRPERQLPPARRLLGVPQLPDPHVGP